MSSGKIVALARSVCAGLLESLGVTSGGAYTPPSGGGIVKAIGMSGHPVITTTSTSVISCDCSIPTSLVGEGGDIVEKTVSGSLNTATLGVGGLATAKTNSTRYYIYMIYNSTTDLVGLIGLTISSRITPAASIDIFTQLPSGYDYYREIGEFYVDSLGDIVPFSRNGDYVTFDDYRQYPVYSAQAMTNAFVEFAFPSGLPARMERVKYTSQNNATGRVMQVWTNDPNGAGESFTATYTNSTSSSYDSMLQSISFWMTLKDTQQSSIFAQHHFSGVASSGSNHYLYISGYKWSV